MSRRDDEPELVLPLPEAKTWAELTSLTPAEQIDVYSDVMAGRRPIADLPEWTAARAGNREALDRIVRIWDTREQLSAAYRAYNLRSAGLTRPLSAL